MKETTEAEHKRRRVGCPEEAAFLELLRTTDMLSRGPVASTQDRGLSRDAVQRAAHPARRAGRAPCGEIASRMITRDPDITRLLDRLEKRELISRCRETKDRRTVMARITPEGLKLLARLDEPVQEAHRKQLGHLGRERLRALAELLRRYAQPGGLIFWAYIVVATNIVVTHLIKAGEENTNEHTGCTANRNHAPGTSTRFTRWPSSR